MKIRELISIDDVRAAKPKMIFYGANTCWWTHDPNHLRVNGRFGPPPRQDAIGSSIIVPYRPERRTVNPGSIPTDPRGGVLFQTDDIEGFLKSAEANVEHYGKHGLRAFIAAHHANSFLSDADPRPWCSDNWDEYNDAIDQYDERSK